MKLTELTYTSPRNGQVWMLRYCQTKSRQTKLAIDAVFRWYYRCDEFDVFDLETMLTTILQDAIENKLATEYARNFVADLMYSVAQSKLANQTKANLIRHIVRSAIESPG